MVFKKTLFLKILLFVFLLILAVFVYRYKQGAYCGVKQPYVFIAGKKIPVEIASTPEEQRQGLSGREKLEKNSGMLFVFPDKKQRFFWMKNMRFPIDIVWLDDEKIVKIDSFLEPEGEHPKKHYPSSVPVNYVLELNAGFCDLHNIKVGEKVKYELE